MKKLLAFTLVIATCLSLVACSSIEKQLYIDGEISDDYKEITSIKGVDFAVPRSVAKKALTEDDIMDKMINENLGEDGLYSLMETEVVCIEAEGRYALFDIDNIVVVVGPVTLKDDFSDIEDADDVEDAVSAGDGLELNTTGDKFLRYSMKNKNKIMCSTKATIGTELGFKESHKLEGYIAIIENEDEDTYMMLAVVDDEDDVSTAEYVAKTFKFNGDDLNSDENESEDNTSKKPSDESEIESKPSNESGPADESNGNESKPSVAPDKNDDIKSMTVLVNGHELKLKSTLSEAVKALNFVFDDEFAEATLDSDDTEYTFIAPRAKDSEWVSVDVINDTEQDNKPIEDCTIYEITAHDFTQGDIEIIFPGNIQVGVSNYDDVIDVYGTPTSEDKDAEYKIHYITYNISDSDCELNIYCEFHLETGKLKTMSYGYDIYV